MLSPCLANSLWLACTQRRPSLCPVYAHINLLCPFCAPYVSSLCSACAHPMPSLGWVTPVWWKWEILCLEQESNPHLWHHRPVCYHYTMKALWCHHYTHTYLYMQFLVSELSTDCYTTQCTQKIAPTNWRVTHWNTVFRHHWTRQKQTVHRDWNIMPFCASSPPWMSCSSFSPRTAQTIVNIVFQLELLSQDRVCGVVPSRRAYMGKARHDGGWFGYREIRPPSGEDRLPICS